MIKEIMQLGSPVLREIAKPVGLNAETLVIIENMKDTLANTQGVGIAAPQIGVSVQIMIIASRPTARYPNAPFMPQTVMLNPSFKALSGIKEKGWEGCLSVPSIRALVPRYTEIEVQYMNESGEIVTLLLNDFAARVFQHEYDHLIGRVFLDSIESTFDIISETEYFKSVLK